MKLIHTIQQTENKEFYSFFKHLQIDNNIRLKTLCEHPKSTIKATQAHYFLKADIVDLDKVNELLKPINISLDIEASEKVVINVNNRI